MAQTPRPRRDGPVHASAVQPARAAGRAQAWLWECDHEGSVTDLSSTFEAATGLSPQTLLGRKLSTIAPLDGQASEYRAAFAAREPFHGLCFTIAGRNGDVWIEIAGMPIAAADGAFRGYRGTGKTVTADREAALALRKSEQRYHELVEAASDWFWETDAEGRIIYASPNVEAALGVPAASYIGKRFADGEHGLIDSESEKAGLAAVEAKQPFRDLVYARKLPDGKTLWVNASGAPFYGEDGTFLGYRGIARNVTAQIEAERTLKESERRFRQLFEVAADYYWESDAQARITYLSGQYEAVVGLPPEQALGKRLGEIPGVSIDPEMAQMAFHAIRNRQPFRDFVYSRQLQNGEKRWFKVSAVPIFGENGEFIGARGIGAGITKHIEAEQAAQLAQRRLHDAVAHVTQPFVFYDADACAVAYNQAFADLHRDRELGQPLFQGVSFRALAEWQLQVRFYAAGDGEEAVTLDDLLAGFQSDGERTYHLRDGRWMLVLYRSLPGGGRVGLWSDVTALKRAEAERRTLERQLHHSQRLEALGTLAGGVAHEINNALVPVIALSKMTAAKLPEDSRERRNLNAVLAGAERSRDLVKQILAFSRKEEEAPRQESVDLTAVVRESLKLMRAAVPTSIALVEEIAPVVPQVCADRKRLEQVIVNLMTNAAQAIGESHGAITVGLRGEADGVHLSVADTGCGMDEPTKARIFEPFFTTKAVGKGTGLGLSVVHGIIKEHGGRIEVESAPGRGSRFDVILPLTPTRLPSAA